MTTEEQMEGNKLIAGFMEIPTIKIWGGGIIYDIERTTLPMNVHVDVNKKMGISTRLLKYNPEQLVFHSSWDWLMPVIQKLKGIVHEQDNFLKMAGRFMGVQEASLQFEINTLWLVVVQFIKWYNANKQ